MGRDSLTAPGKDLGNKEILKAAGIDVKVDNPTVGENLQEDMLAMAFYEMNPSISTAEALRGDPAFAKAADNEHAAIHTGDCAPLYGNEPEIGEAFKTTTVPRNEYFVTTKLWSSDHQRVQSALDKSLQDLNLTYVDLYLMHWPIALDTDADAEYGKENRHRHLPGWDFCNTWQEMEKLLATGKVRAIGVANFSTKNLDILLRHARVVPAVNQTELHPLLPQDKLHAYCQAHGIHQTAFGPLGGSGSTMHQDEVILKIAKARGVDAGNVMLSWGVQKGWSVIPKSTKRARIASNLQGLFVLSNEEMEEVDQLAKTGGRRFNRPDWGTVVFHDDEGLALS